MKGLSKAVFARLRAHRGQKFTPDELADLTGFGRSAVSNELSAKFHDGRRGLMRELMRYRGSKSSYRYYLVDPAIAGAEDHEETLIARWMHRYNVSVRPSVVARAVGMPVGRVAGILERWHEEGSAVRCTLALRSGFDHYEYRLAHSSGANFGNRPTRVFGERFLAT